MKVALDTKEKDGAWGKVKPYPKIVKYALPYFKGNAGKYFHRLRKAHQHWRDGKFSHMSVGFWCGNSGQMDRGKLYATIPDGEVLCATCEGKAIGAGMDGSRLINGRPVMYSPRERNKKPFSMVK